MAWGLGQAVSSYLGGRFTDLFVKNDEVNGEKWGYGGNITMGDITVCFDRGKMVDLVTRLVKTIAIEGWVEWEIQPSNCLQPTQSSRCDFRIDGL